MPKNNYICKKKHRQKMKLKYCFVGLLAISSFISCKIDTGENKPEPAAQQEEKLSSGKVMITMNAIVPADDKFQVFYNEAGTLDFDGEHTVTVSVFGKDTPQDIRFSLPDEALPTALRIDTGDSKDQGKLTINSITVNYYDKSLVIKGGDEFLKYFQPNNLEKERSDATSATFTVKPVNGNYDPMFYPSGELINALKGILVK